MSVLTTVRTARKRHRCEHCLEKIQPGQRYETYAMTPGDEFNDGRFWRHGASHLPNECPRDGRDPSKGE